MRTEAVNKIILFHDVGGLHGQKENAYLLREWISKFTNDQKDFQFINYQITALKPYINWKPGSWWAMNKNLPTVIMITFNSQSLLPELKGLTVKVSYEIYNGIPLSIRKRWNFQFLFKKKRILYQRRKV